MSTLDFRRHRREPTASACTSSPHFVVTHLVIFLTRCPVQYSKPLENGPCALYFAHGYYAAYELHPARLSSADRFFSFADNTTPQEAGMPRGDELHEFRFSDRDD